MRFVMTVEPLVTFFLGVTQFQVHEKVKNILIILNLQSLLHTQRTIWLPVAIQKRSFIQKILRA